MNDAQAALPSPRSEHDSRHSGAGVAAVVLAFALLLGFLGTQPPAPVPASAPADTFSAERAMAGVREIARAPHPVGTVEHERVRDYLIRHLRALDCDVQIQRTTSISSGGGAFRATNVENIVARRRGSSGKTDALLLAAHYDSAPNSLGACDDGAGVAALLEALRALSARPPLQNDLIILLSDGEEVNLMGARAFVEQHPWAHDVRLVLNFEARGNTGPSYLFQTSPGNARLIGEVAASVPHASANSLTYEVYRRLPNDTDLTVFLAPGAGAARRPLPGLNFAFIGGYTHYHTPLDRPDELDPRSLQQQGEYALYLARRLGDADLGTVTRAGAGDAVYFTTPPIGFVRYPTTWALPLALLASGGYLAFVVLGFRYRALRGRGVAWGALALLGTLLLAPALAHFGWQAIRALHPGYRFLPTGDTYNSTAYLAAFGSLTAVVTGGIYGFAQRRASALDLFVVPAALWSALALLTAVLLPGASYVFLWPLLFALAGALWCLRGVATSAALPGTDDSATAGPGRALVLGLCGAPTLILIPPLVWALQTAMTLNLVAGEMLLLALAGALLSLQIAALGRGWRVLFPTLGALAVAALVLAEAGSGFSAQRRRPDSLLYLLDAEQKRALWVSFDPAPDAWTRLLLGDTPTRASVAPYGLGDGTALSAPAPLLGVPAPRVEVLESRPTNDGRRVHVRLHPSSPQTTRLAFFPDQDGIPVRAVVLDNKPLSPGQGKRFGVTCDAPSAAGIDLWMTIATPAPVRWRLSDRTPGLPATVPPRPDDAMAQPFLPTDITLVQQVIDL